MQAQACGLGFFDDSPSVVMGELTNKKAGDEAG
jgi:hypothetical protein